MVTPIFSNDGSTLEGITLSDASVVVYSGTGNPAPSIRVPSGSYFIFEVPSISDGSIISADVFINSTSTALFDIMAFTNASVVGGLMVRLDCRSAYPCFFGSPNGIPVNYDISIIKDGGAYRCNAGVFLNVKIMTRNISNQSEAQLWIDDVLVIDWTPYTPSGAYIAFVGDISITSGGLVDNINIYSGATISGVAKLSSGAPASKIRIRDWDTALHVAEILPDATGNYNARIYAGSFEVTAIGPAGYQPETHGPIAAGEV